MRGLPAPWAVMPGIGTGQRSVIRETVPVIAAPVIAAAGIAAGIAAPGIAAPGITVAAIASCVFLACVGRSHGQPEQT
jgi:hypothetical protein